MNADSRRGNLERSRYRYRSAPFLAGAAAIPIALLAILFLAGRGSAQTSTSEPPSAIGNQFVPWIAVSPSYETTGLVLAVSQNVRCSKGEDCRHLWVTRDGGATWKKAKAEGWEFTRPVIAVNQNGGESMFSGGVDGVQRSDDAGETWRTVGPNGLPTPMPSYPEDEALVVAASPDYILRGSTRQEIRGSGGKIVDMSFAFAPTFPNAQDRPPALLAGANKRNTYPVIQQCTADLVCSGSTVLPGTAEFSIPVTLHLSSKYADDGVVFAQAGSGIYKSLDAGGTFVQLQIGEPNASGTATPQMALAPGYAEGGPVRTVFVALLQIHSPTVPSIDDLPRAWGGIYRSRDGGTTWARVGSPSPLDQGASAVSLAPDGRLFAGYMPGRPGKAGLLCSTDGNSWRASCPAVGEAAKITGGKSVDASSEGGGPAAPDEQNQGGFLGALPERIASTAKAATRYPWSLASAVGVVALVVIIGAAIFRSRRHRALRGGQ